MARALILALLVLAGTAHAEPTEDDLGAVITMQRALARLARALISD